MIVASALLFLVSIPVICASGLFAGGNFWMMVAGRAMQGAAAGLFGVIVLMYLAECPTPTRAARARACSSCSSRSASSSSP